MQRFASDYGAARARFLQACAARRAAVDSVEHPGERGPSGERLYADIAWLGESAAPDLLIVSSATHGVEGLCGSGIQSELLAGELLRAPPAGVAVALVHASNPHGFAHLRRVTEGNVDLNRNFIDHSKPPANAAYDEIHDWLVPSSWSGVKRIEAELALARYRAERGDAALQAAATGGQYAHPDGLFFGGRSPVWSNSLWRKFVAEHCRTRRHIAHLDLHTGLGPYGYGEKIVAVPLPAAELARLKRLFGEDLKSPWSGDSASAPVNGALASVFADVPAGTRVSPIALEFGTVPLEHMLSILRADNWIHAHARGEDAAVSSMRHLMKAAFFVEEDDWQSAVVARTGDTVRRTLAGLGGTASDA